MPDATTAAVQSQMMTAADAERGAPDGGIGRRIAEHKCLGKMPLAWSESDPARDGAKTEDSEADQVLHDAHPSRRFGGQFAGRVGVAERLDGDRDAGQKKCQACAEHQPQRTVQI